MRFDLTKIIYAVGILVFMLALYIVPFISITPIGDVEIIYTFAELVGGRSPYLMTGANTATLAALPVIPLLVALLIPAQTESNTRLITIMTVILFALFAVSIAYPILEAAAILLGSAANTTMEIVISSTWGTSLVIYWGLGCLFFVGFTMFPAVRRQIS